MFTGIISRLATIAAIDPSEGGGSIRLQAEPWERPYELGESIAVQGVCLTLAGFDTQGLRFDILQETFDRTNLGAKRAGDRLNLERALRYGDAMGGHLVSGHVDGIGTLAGIEEVGRDWRVDITCGPELLAGMIYKGSVCLDGISLTIAALDEQGFSVHIIPHTLEQTSLGRAQAGDALNLEIDLAGKFIKRMVERGETRLDMDWETLQKEGWN